MTTAPSPQRIGSTANPLLKRLRRLAQEPDGYRKAGQLWVEGEHLCAAAAARGWRPVLALYSESSWLEARLQPYVSASRNVVVPDRLYAALSALDSPTGLAWVLPLGPAPAPQPAEPTVLLDRLQDPGNVGSILRSAAAFGFTQVMALKGTAALWSPKVLRAGMGAHFGLRLIEGCLPAEVDALALPILQTSSHRGEWLHETALPWPCAWVFGHEGQGITEALAAHLATRPRGIARFVRIAQPGGGESLNVAAAAAICLHASMAAMPGNRAGAVG